MLLGSALGKVTEGQGQQSAFSSQHSAFSGLSALGLHLAFGSWHLAVQEKKTLTTGDTGKHRETQEERQALSIQRAECVGRGTKKHEPLRTQRDTKEKSEECKQSAIGIQHSAG